MGVSLAGEIQSENVLSRLMYYIPGKGDPKRTKVGISLLPVHLYMGDRCWRQNKADIMKVGPKVGSDRASDNQGDPSDWSGMVRKLGCSIEWVWGETGQGGANGK